MEDTDMKANSKQNKRKEEFQKGVDQPAKKSEMENIAFTFRGPPLGNETLISVKKKLEGLLVLSVDVEKLELFIGDHHSAQ